MVAAEEIEIVNLDALRLEHCRLTAQMPQLQRVGDRLDDATGDVVLNREHVVHLRSYVSDQSSESSLTRMSFA